MLYSPRLVKNSHNPRLTSVLGQLSLAGCVLAMLALVAGCERQREADDPAAYDPAIDGPRRGANVHVDPNLVVDQATISKAAEKAGETLPDEPATVGGASGTSTASAR